MKQNVIFINTARSAIVDNQALFKNIKSGKFFAVVIDVMQQEPVKKTHPFLSFSNVIVTPHIAFNTIESEYKLATIVTKNIIRFIKNSPQNVVI